MIICSVDGSGGVMTISYSQHVDVQDMRRCLENVRHLLDQLRPGFLVLADFTSLESMDANCAHDLGALMDLCSGRGMATVMRVIPDSSKEIGINIISRFHLQPQVKVHTYGSLAEAIKSLLPGQADESPLIPSSVS